MYSMVGRKHAVDTQVHNVVGTLDLLPDALRGGTPQLRSAARDPLRTFPERGASLRRAGPSAEIQVLGKAAPRQ